MFKKLRKAFQDWKEKRIADRADCIKQAEQKESDDKARLAVYVDAATSELTALGYKVGGVFRSSYRIEAILLVTHTQSGRLYRVDCDAKGWTVERT